MNVAGPWLLAALAGASMNASSPDDSEVLLRLATPRVDYVQHETVDLVVTVKNVSDHDVRMTLVLRPDRGRLGVHWRRPGGDFEPLDYLARRDPDVLAYRSTGGGRWPAGRGLVFHVPVGFDGSRKRFLLDEPGEYQFKLIYRRADEQAPRLESNVVTIAVAAVGDGDRASFEAYDPDIAWIAEYRMLGPQNTERAVKAGEYLERFPASPYAPAVLAGLKRYLGEHQSRLTSEEAALSKRFGMAGAEDYIKVIPGKGE